MGATFARLRHLRELKFSANYCHKVNEKGMLELGTGISQTALRSLEASFIECAKLGDKCLKNFCGKLGSISKIPGLQKLNLNFSNCEKLTDSGVGKATEFFMELSHI